MIDKYHLNYKYQKQMIDWYAKRAKSTQYYESIVIADNSKIIATFVLRFTKKVH